VTQDDPSQILANLIRRVFAHAVDVPAAQRAGDAAAGAYVSAMAAWRRETAQAVVAAMVTSPGHGRHARRFRSDRDRFGADPAGGRMTPPMLKRRARGKSSADQGVGPHGIPLADFIFQWSDFVIQVGGCDGGSARR
jgi:hypothetical protein